MPEYCVPIEVWFLADNQTEADRLADELNDFVAERPEVRAVANGPAEDQS